MACSQARVAFARLLIINVGLQCKTDMDTMLLRYTGFGGTRAGISTQFGPLSGTCQVRAWPDETGFCTKRETLGSEGCECEASVCVRACVSE